MKNKSKTLRLEDFLSTIKIEISFYIVSFIFTFILLGLIFIVIDQQNVYNYYNNLPYNGSYESIYNYNNGLIAKDSYDTSFRILMIYLAFYIAVLFAVFYSKIMVIAGLKKNSQVINKHKKMMVWQFFIPFLGFIFVNKIKKQVKELIKISNENNNSKIFDNNLEQNLNYENTNELLQKNQNLGKNTTKENNDNNWDSISNLDQELTTLKKLYNSGEISKEEYNKLKSKLISSI